MKTQSISNIDVYLDEYTRDDIIARYISDTAGAGIAHVLNEVYAPIYRRLIAELSAVRPPGHRFRILEYGCGGGMNLLKLIDLLRVQGAELKMAYGTDFSKPMIDAARAEAALRLPASMCRKITYVVANNETLTEDLAHNLAVAKEDLHGTFDLVVGVNTFRYCHRLAKETKAAADIFNLLRPGGYSVMIDMNKHFPLFRSKVKRLFQPRTIETYVPSLAEYAAPFAEAGFALKEKRNFCWIPHSANPRLLSLCRTLTPVLDTCCRKLAMRSLVIGQKPG
jgi:SAM-dependent methyltransferase